MKNNTETKTIMNDVEYLLKQSIDIYSEVGAIYKSLVNASLNSMTPNAIGQNNERISLLFSKGKEIDIQISLLQNDGCTNNTENPLTLLRQRETLLQDLIVTNTTIVKKAKNVKFLLKHDFATIAKSHTAISGYGNHSPTKRNILNDSF